MARGCALDIVSLGAFDCDEQLNLRRILSTNRNEIYLIYFFFAGMELRIRVEARFN